MSHTQQPGAAPADAGPASGLNVSRIAMWLAIGMLVAAALLGGFFIIVGDQSNVAGRAWLTLLLVAAFAGAVLIDTAITRGKNPWYLGASTVVNVLIIAVGLLKIWNGWGQPADTADERVWSVQMLRLIGVLLLLRAALGITQLYIPFTRKMTTPQVSKIAGYGAIAFGWLTALVLAIPAAFPAPDYPDWWWRVAGATALIAVVLTVIPLIIRAFQPRDDASPQHVAQGYAQPVYPAQAPGYPPQPGYPAQPGYPVPGQQPRPEHQAYGAQPAYPAQQGHPAQPGYPAPGQQGHLPQQGYPTPGQQPYPASQGYPAAQGYTAPPAAAAQAAVPAAPPSFPSPPAPSAYPAQPVPGAAPQYGQGVDAAQPPTPASAPPTASDGYSGDGRPSGTP